MLRAGVSNVLPRALAVTSNPESLTQFVHRVKDCGVSPAQLLECMQQYVNSDTLEAETSHSVLYGLLLALGEYELDEFPEYAEKGLG